MHRRHCTEQSAPENPRPPRKFALLRMHSHCPVTGGPPGAQPGGGTQTPWPCVHGGHFTEQSDPAHPNPSPLTSSQMQVGAALTIAHVPLPYVGEHGQGMSQESPSQPASHLHSMYCEAPVNTSTLSGSFRTQWPLTHSLWHMSAHDTPAYCEKHWHFPSTYLPCAEHSRLHVSNKSPRSASSQPGSQRQREPSGCVSLYSPWPRQRGNSQLSPEYPSSQTTQ
mmetsp:Transcript_6504/g.22429  ORF Transcript_6504/g.22429 Transcript_6504/m.22429 type:complete len:223 (+) Transcript_6504:6197-6865(+)